ncbi:MAG: IclR family transcriptional regulator [Deltaproteobacteria bacterium]|nr:IclR family transcriptional regulator [Deltaproteobacteria bacterium]
MKDKIKNNKDRYVSPAVEQAARILFRLAETQAPYTSLIEICDRVGLHKSKAFTILETLQRFGLIRKNEEGKGYALGPSLITLSRKVLDDLSAPRLAEPILEDLAGRTGTTAALGLIAGQNVFVAAKREGPGPVVVTMRVGHRLPLTYGCHGKAIAAFLPETELADLLKDKKLYFSGDPSRFDKAKVMEDIARCRRDWFAEDLEETAPGLNAVAAPVLGPNGRPIGYIVVLGLASAEAARQSGPLVAAAGKSLSRQLGAGID